jgi:hypothetical protein
MERGTELAATFILHMHQRAWCNIARFRQVGAIDPEVPAPQTLGTAGRDRDDGKRFVRRQRTLADLRMFILNLCGEETARITVKGSCLRTRPMLLQS